MFNLRVINSINILYVKSFNRQWNWYPKAGSGISFGKILFDT